MKGNQSNQFSEFLHDVCHEVHLPLEDALRDDFRLLKMKGAHSCTDHRLTDILTGVRHHRLEAKRVQFVYPKGKKSNIVLIELMKDGLPGVDLALLPITVFDEHQEYTQKIRSILWGTAHEPAYVRPSLQGSPYTGYTVDLKTNRDSQCRKKVNMLGESP